ncbi:methyltransferase domain-containing protein [Paraneptunicella aestuarii]|uniref:methyltransferase domain-containing protein n=1 Tax=Paraneptunicella aestuarii TaxID=2831148 RepID=UPI001E2A7B4D|nr:methyltransferase domain-containing protein [Paraneptunicella aestuarii]UAA40457.1 methyltransferase domain-containing protein [Paraneptunicella aestuarii]
MIAEQALKQRIARQFSLAAMRYDDKADVQDSIAKDALCLLPNKKVSRMLDVGCGTGRVTRWLTEFSEQVLGVDLSHGMLNYARKHYGEPHIHWLTGDADALPLANASVDGVFSSMALQWSAAPSLFLGELHRVCVPTSQLVLAIMTDGSLFELQECWQQVDKHRHVNQFCSAEQLIEAAYQAGFEGSYHTRSYCTWHSSAIEAMHSIKDVGAGVVKRKDKKSLGKKQLSLLELQYQRQFQSDGKLPLTYQVCFLELTR